jgi:ATP-dependent helicase/nuclease subunit B
LAEIIAKWNLQSEVLPVFDPLVYPAFFESLLAPEIYHLQAGLHPRLHILSPMEARLQQFDLVIMGGLNEGTWPKNSEVSPWMNRPQRLEFGLPSYERSVGQSAHDAQMLLFSSPEILLTRARKVEGTPTIPSRWLVRMQTLIQGKNHQFFADMNVVDYFTAAKNILEKPSDIALLTAPAPSPPLASRPRFMRVTAIDRWLRDPYSIYAQYILNLRSLEDLDREPDAADFGNLIHKALECFTNSHPTFFPKNAREELLAAGRISFADFLDRPAVACLWFPRFVNMVDWLVAEEKIRRQQAVQIHSEVKGEWKFTVDGKNFTLSTRIDRVEKLSNGFYAIIDYKTGMIPSNNERERGLANQLPLEALIVQHGELSQEITAGVVGEMQYWKLAGNTDKCEITNVEMDLQEVRSCLENLIRQFDNSEQPYFAQTDPALLRYNDYEHLTRRKEWELV